MGACSRRIRIWFSPESKLSCHQSWTPQLSFLTAAIRIDLFLETPIIDKLGCEGVASVHLVWVSFHNHIHVAESWQLCCISHSVHPWLRFRWMTICRIDRPKFNGMSPMGDSSFSSSSHASKFKWSSKLKSLLYSSMVETLICKFHRAHHCLILWWNALQPLFLCSFHPSSFESWSSGSVSCWRVLDVVLGVVGTLAKTSGVCGTSTGGPFQWDLETSPVLALLKLLLQPQRRVISLTLSLLPRFCILVKECTGTQDHQLVLHHWQSKHLVVPLWTRFTTKPCFVFPWPAPEIDVKRQMSTPCCCNPSDTARDHQLITIKQQLGILRISFAKEKHRRHRAVPFPDLCKPKQVHQSCKLHHYRTPQRAACGEFHPTCSLEKCINVPAKGLMRPTAFSTKEIAMWVWRWSGLTCGQTHG